MHGELIYARAISQLRTKPDRYGVRWQYHPRSDAHSKAGMMAVMFDLLIECRLLREHIAQGVVGFGINHKMSDYRSDRTKNLDLVVCRPNSTIREVALSEQMRRYGIVLTDEEADLLADLPPVKVASVTTALIAIEAKACMTEHQKALSRLYDELSSSFQTINGDTNETIAAAFVTVNASKTFTSPLRNRSEGEARPKPSRHAQPKATRIAIDKISQLRRRASPKQSGFDAVGITLVDFSNDGTPALLVPENP